jgi:monoamine oxidase
MGKELSRRRFLQLIGAASAAGALPSVARALPRTSGVLLGPAWTYDDGNRRIPGGLAGDPGRVIVVGAGFAGLAVANALGNAGVECVVLEGRERLGGRAHTVQVGGDPVDLGCSWITDPVGNPMTRFALQSGVAQTNAAIELDVPTSRFYDARTGIVLPPGTAQAVAHALRFEELDAGAISDTLGPGASTKDGILYYANQKRLTGNLRRRAEYFMRLLTELPDATDWDKDSLQAWVDYSSPYVGVGQGNFPRGGYVRLVESLGGGADVRFGHRVTGVVASGDGVRVSAVDPAGAPVELDGSHAVVTAPLGVLKAGSIAFTPALPARKRDAITRLGFGTFEKVVMRFPEPYWATEHTHIFHLSDPDPMRFPLVVDYFHLEAVPILVAFNVGTHAIELDGMTDAAIRDRMLEVLRAVQGGPVPRPTDVAITRWGRDSFSNGSYSFIAVGSTPADQDALATPLAGRVLFAGEASSRARFGYADGALSTGIREAKRLLRRPSVRLRAYGSPLPAPIG